MLIIKTIYDMVEVFKTNVHDPKEAKFLIGVIRNHLPKSKINFDLSDCDKILRVESRNIEVNTIQRLISENGFTCTVLED